ncbi:MAG: 1-deoxy-D-xylulose-5-phosphate reductoisomerase [Gammaproteobacteria bacterium]|nr:1-deoxy-D-xylulose-5-phosphate reductoisomerase [Gammaproteobacteria bacterium]
MKNILLLGATGSIGDSVLDVISQNQDKLNLIGISINSNVSKAKKIIQKFNPSHLYIEDSNSFNAFEKQPGLKLYNNKKGLEDIINLSEIDIIVSAISGFAGLESTYISSRTGKTILLANKESIVAGGDFILSEAKKFNTTILPIDSEHNAIFQCLPPDQDIQDVKKVTITASGGPFLNSDLSELQKVTKEQALSHPNWSMGSKISIDSATLVNKCLELIEAKYLFNLDEKYFELVVHPQSIIHSIVTYLDGSSICQLSNPDMRVPIAHALSGKNRLPLDFNALDFSSLNLSFQEFPKDRMQIQNLAREVCNVGGLSGVIFNAANEIAVDNFLKGQIKFTEIYDVIFRTFDISIMSNEMSLDAINQMDIETRIKAEKVVKSIA